MSIPLNVNGVVYDYPETDDQDWGPDATDWASAVTTGMLQKAGGLFQLLAEVDFGTSYGLKALYYKSRTANPADAGQVRLARADVINWRNQANGGNLSLGVSASDNLQFNGVDIQPSISVSDTATIDLTLAANVLSAAIVNGSITNAMINASAAIAYSKLNLSGSIVNADINASAAIAQSKLSLAITNAELSGSAGITNANLATMADLRIKGNVSGGAAVPSDLTGAQVTAILSNFVGDSGSGGTKGLVPAPITGDASKFLRGDGVFATPPGAGDVVGPASSVDGAIALFDDTTGKLLTELSGTGLVKVSTGVASAAALVNADVAAGAAIAYSKLAALTASRALVSDGSGAVSVATTTATEIDYVSGVTSAIQTQLNGKEPTITVLSLAKGGTNKNMTAVAGGVVWTDADSMEVSAAGTSGQYLKSNGTSAPTWVTIPGAYYWSGYYDASTTNYWSNTNTGGFGDFTTNGTIPSPVALQTSNWTTVSKATSNLPGLNFSAPRTGTIKFTLTFSFIGSNSTTVAETWAIKFLESTTTTNIAFGSGKGIGVATANNYAPIMTLVGYFAATASTTYNFKLQSVVSGGTSFIGATTNAGACLSFAMEYIT